MIFGVKHLLHALELSHLPLGVVLFVGRVTREWKRIVWVLRMALMEDIVLSVVPVGEGCAVRTRLLDWLGRFLDLFLFGGDGFAFITSVFGFVRGDEVHPVRVNDLGLFLHIEGLFVALYVGLGQLIVVVLSVIGEQSLGVRVAHEAIGAASHSRTLVPSRKSRVSSLLPD